MSAGPEPNNPATVARIIRENAGHRRQVADVSVDHTKQCDDGSPSAKRFLPFRQSDAAASHRISVIAVRD